MIAKRKSSALLPNPLRLLSLSLRASVLLYVAQVLSVGAGSSQNRLPFKLGIRDSLMIAHSFRHPDFGPAQNLHGATYTCDVEFQCAALQSPQNWVMDIGKASTMLSKVLSNYNFQNLDEVFPNGELTTTEFMAQRIHEQLAQCIKGEGIPFKGNICVKLWESHKAWASYEAEVR